ncbi:hypothetical protein GCM10010411_67270 [Actinomadura fulvescens]|uniref:Uncharacterized protein n=1 Tax=Actinomadura fulvescens TaxID=46160 RepID=A0ABN3QBC1_9ACTN
MDSAMESSPEGMRTLWISVAGLGATAVIQAVVVALSGSVALFGDTLHRSATRQWHRPSRPPRGTPMIQNL